MTSGEPAAPVTPRPARDRTSHGVTFWLAVGVVACLLAGYLYIAVMHALPLRMTLNWYDFRVYMDSGRIARQSPAQLYTWQLNPQTRFTYTPFAAVVFGAISMLPWDVAAQVMTAVSIAGLAVLTWLTFGQMGWRGGRRVGVAMLVSAIAFWTEPVHRGLQLGQVELLLAVLIIWDLGQPGRRWWQGGAIGLAAGIKLVPLIFIPFLLLSGKFRQAAVATAAFAISVATGFALLPGVSAHWWLTGYFLHAGRTGGVASLANQSLLGMMSRMAGSVQAATPAWLAVAAVTGLAGLAGAAALHRSGYPVHGWLLCALTGLLVSPISWDHHWVWIAPLLVVATDAAVRARGAIRWAGWLVAGAVIALFTDWPGTVSGRQAFLPRGVLWMVYGTPYHPYDQLYHWHGAEVLVGNSYVLAGLVLFAGLLTTAGIAGRRRGTPPAAGPLPGPLPERQVRELVVG